MLEKKELVDLFLVFLAFVSVGLLMFEFDHPEAVTVTVPVDFAIAVFFLGEYIHSIHSAERHFHYAVSHWYDLLASIPMPFSAVRALRTVRIIRLARFIRTMRALRLSRAFVFLEESKIGYVLVAFVMALLLGATLFHTIEYGENPQLRSSLDALYWAVATLSTVGYGDIVAVTSLGKLITIGLMIFGIGIYSSLAGLLAGYLMKNSQRSENQHEEK
ncbi:MAG: ion transporter [Nitrososphaerota archaeon]